MFQFVQERKPAVMETEEVVSVANEETTMENTRTKRCIPVVVRQIEIL